jgi:hypothetical protein
MSADDPDFDPLSEIPPPDEPPPYDDLPAFEEAPPFDQGSETSGDATSFESTEPEELPPGLQALVEHSVNRRISKELATIAEAQFEEALTPELYERMQTATARALAAHLEEAARRAEAEADNAEAKPVYETLLDFVDEMIRPHYRREVVDGNSRKWCPQWWAHGEAYRRLDALWRAWEHLRQDPNTGMSVWWRDHADHHMSKLFDPQGPFSACSVKHGHKTSLPPLPADPPDPALFGTPADPRTAAPAPELVPAAASEGDEHR